MMYQPKTRVVREGYRWHVERFAGCLGWQRYCFSFPTRSRARAHQAIWAQA
jgi:hypothetical protein